MKKAILNLSILAILCCTSLVACKKKDETPAPTITPTVTPTVTTNGFTWSENGGATKTATTAKFTVQYNTLIASGPTSNTIIEINLSGNTPATYTLNSNGNALAFTPSTFNTTGGSVIISKNANGKMSGTFTAQGTGGSVTSISGSFENITVE